MCPSTRRIEKETRHGVTRKELAEENILLFPFVFPGVADTYVGIKIMKTLAINLLTSKDPS
ncbi:hypothetical protein E2C01_071475 [Portunus trituberculatus]|uniref:Uncharacterized protein n=1 Tax=Portunus trituberculatus TaxID=210409 RepID=A0A5B7I518_PORTR|nr:hypothetical protein [Portunus trituberculatus]